MLSVHHPKAYPKFFIGLEIIFDSIAVGAFMERIFCNRNLKIISDDEFGMLLNFVRDFFESRVHSNDSLPRIHRDAHGFNDRSLGGIMQLLVISIPQHREVSQKLKST